MAILVGIYILIGIVRSLGQVADTNPGRKPTWMLTEQNPLAYATHFVFHALLWPLGMLSK